MKPKAYPLWNPPPSDSTDEVVVTKYCPVTPAPTLPTTLTPGQIGTPHTPPVILHISSTKLPPQTLLDLIVSHTELSASYTRALAAFGGVYMRLGEARPRVSPRAIRQNEPDLNRSIAGIVYVRLYANPKRHRALTRFRVLFEDDEVIVMCKPAGIPVAASVDNQLECVLQLVQEHCGVDAHITSRLDVGTSGVLMVGKSREGGNKVNGMLRCATKKYVVWSRNKAGVGVHSDWYNSKASLRRNSTDRIIQHEEESGWVNVRLEVEQVEWCCWRKCWKSRVRLLTGRTHQIRLQFALRGCVVLGDVKYMDLNKLGGDAEWLGLHCVSVEGIWRGEEMQFVAEASQEAIDLEMEGS